ncbi:hypothetical protein F511_07023 [Dorcoceras hygrometricum]|uniref:DUF4408 domain-containing protein n=1 Tax=Dorcoceras hygrometricum TaxID=472368 RepID=A0A2Z7D0P3_9LAMI|nr:hypothetical protein F511_07023 [Dorcoceras hygrometricum]
MDMLKFHNVRIEKANVILRYRSFERITTLFRFVELCFILTIVSKFSNQFQFTLKSSGEYFRSISVILISPRFVFVVGNVIMLMLFLRSGEFSSKKGEKPADLYEEYVEKCRRNQETFVAQVKTAASDHGHKYGVCSDGRKMYRSCSVQNLVKGAAHGDHLRRSMTEKSRSHRQKCGGSSKAEDDMSCEEFRQTVEAFIARQQRFLREEEE